MAAIVTRLARATAGRDRYRKIRYQPEAVDSLLLELFLDSHAQPPEQIVLDLDVTDLPLHGRHEGRFFHGFYDEYCYLPRYLFCGDQLLGVRLRTADQDASADSRAEVYSASSVGSARAGARYGSSCAPIRASAAEI